MVFKSRDDTCLTDFYSFSSTGHCLLPDPVNNSDVRIVGVGIGNSTITPNITQYTVGVVSCPHGQAAEKKPYVYCNGSNGTLDVEEKTRNRKLYNLDYRQFLIIMKTPLCEGR